MPRGPREFQRRPAQRSRGMELAGLMLEAAHELGTENLLVVPGAVHSAMNWRDSGISVKFVGYFNPDDASA